MKKRIFILALLVSFFPIQEARSAISPLGVSILPPLQFPPSDFGVTGVRASVLWGKHRDLYGLDFGLIGNITEQDFVGIGVSGLFNITKGNTYIIGLQFAGITNYNVQKTKVVGFQLAGGMNFNIAESSVVGVQLAPLGNIASHTTIYGLQVGLYNSAREVYGLQIGLINRTDNLHGIQIGLLNFNHSGTFVVSPIINVGF